MSKYMVFNIIGYYQSFTEKFFFRGRGKTFHHKIWGGGEGNVLYSNLGVSFQGGTNFMGGARGGGGGGSFVPPTHPPTPQMKF